MCLTVHEELRRDPTRTTTLRNKYSAEMYKRFRRLKGRILEEIVKRDGFGLRTNQGRFEFTRTADKVNAFMTWLEQAASQEILEVQVGTPVRRAAETSWQNVYLRGAYLKGISSSAMQLRKGGAEVRDSFIDAAFRRPIHADRIGIIYTRAYRDLKNVTDQMDAQMSRVLAESLANGMAPEATARALNDRVDKIGITRSRMIAQTETINAHAEASLNAYEEAGVEGVQVMAEFATAGDSKVCPECRALEDRVANAGGWPLDRARGVIPVHPRCRCAWIPIVQNGTGIELS